MELKIDTAKDTKEDIQRAISFLQGFLAQSERLAAETAVPSSLEAPLPESIIQTTEAATTAIPPITNIPQPSTPETPVKEPPKEDDTIEITPGALNMFDQAVTNAPPAGSTPEAKAGDAAGNIDKATAEPAPEKKTADEITKTHRMVSVAELLKEPLKVVFKKNDNELEEVQKLKKMSKTTAENLRIIAYN
jgi:hypothetical protein